MKRASILLVFLIACGTETTSYPISSERCQPYHETYSHSVIHCFDAQGAESQSVYFACNPRVRPGDRQEGCVSDLLLKSSDECYSENVCMNVADWE